jgi:hypothetical protein
MGLHPESKSSKPWFNGDFIGGDVAGVRDFARWHDEQDDPAALVDAIWPLGNQSSGSK